MAKYELTGLDNYTTNELLKELRRVASTLKKKTLTRSSFDKCAKVYSGTIVRKFGTWEKALSLAGLSHLYSGRVVTRKMRLQPSKKMSNKELLDELRRVAKSIGESSLSRIQFDKLSRVNSSAIERRFGSWRAGIEQAGLKIKPHGRRHKEEDYFENLLTVWTYYGRQPKNREMDVAPSEITGGAYEAKFGSWRKALQAFVSKMNSTQDIEKTEEGTETKESNTSPVVLPVEKDQNKKPIRTVPIGLRYNVLRRDSFRCVLCGASPATDPKCRLHVDHILPWSAGGSTTIDNLRTLCEKCNLGKGNKIE